MPLIQNEEQLQQLESVSNVNVTLLFQERLRERYKPHEFVKVINVDDEDFIWQYMPESGEETAQSSDGMHRIVTRTRPEVWLIEPGETEVLQGANANVMIEALYKKISAKRVIAKTPNQSATSARNFNWTDPIAQEEAIDRIYLGKEKLNFGVTKDEEPTRTVGRPPKVTSADI